MTSRIVERAVLIVAAGALMGALAVRFVPTDRASGSARTQPVSESGIDTLLVFLLSSTCAACTSEPGFSEVIRYKRELWSQDRPKIRFVGIAVDWSVSAGLDLLYEFGDFDEMSVGEQWSNSAVFQYIWSDSASNAAVPQLLVLQREKVVSADQTRIALGQLRKLDVALGLQEMAARLAALR